MEYSYKKTTRTILLLGSNMGDTKVNLLKAKDLIDKNIGKITLSSDIYRSESWGFVGNDFLNQVVCCDTTLSAEEVLFKIWDLERVFGRVREGVDKELEKLKLREQGLLSYENRGMDIDILLYGNSIISTNLLTIPHPKISDRLFVLKPLSSIIGEEILPGYTDTVNQLLQKKLSTFNTFL